MRRDDAAGRAGRLARLGQRAVQRSPPHPRDVGVQRVARQPVPEHSGARVLLACQASLEQLRHPVRARQRRDQIEIEELTRDRGGLGRRAALADSSDALMSTASRTVSGSGISPW